MLSAKTRNRGGGADAIVALITGYWQLLQTRSHRFNHKISYRVGEDDLLNSKRGAKVV